jgi:hypothetical protein
VYASHLLGRVVGVEKEHHLRASPSEILASPSELLTSPSELLTSPSNLLTSPRETLSVAQREL